MYGTAVEQNTYEPVRLIKLTAAAARSKGDPVVVSTGSNTTGTNLDASLADNTNIYKVAVAMENAATGDVYTAAVEGTVTITTPSITTVVGDGLLILDGAVAAAGADAQDRSGEATNTHFCICHEASTGTSHVVTLFGDAITGTT